MAKGPVPSPIIDDSDLVTVPERLAAERRRLRRSILGSGLFHLLILALLFGLWPRSAPEESPPITVELVPGVGAAGAAGGSGGGALAEGPARDGAATTPQQTADSTADSASTTPESAPAETTTATESTPPDTAAADTAAAPPAPAQPQPAIIVTASPPPAAQTQASTTGAEVQPSMAAQSTPPEAMPPPPPHKPRPPKPSTKLAAAPPSPAQQPAPESTPAPSAETASAAIIAPTPGTPGSGGGSGGTGGVGQGVAGAGEGVVGSGKGPGDDYLDRVRRHIRQYLTYPEVARKQKREGDATMAVVLRRDGTVLSAKIEQSTGYPELDNAILKAVHDASPVPPFPKSYEREQGEVILPFDFHLGLIDRIFR